MIIYRGFIHSPPPQPRSPPQISMTVGCVLGLLACNILLCSIGEAEGDRGCQKGNAQRNTSLHGTVFLTHAFLIHGVFSLSKKVVVTTAVSNM